MSSKCQFPEQKIIPLKWYATQIRKIKILNVGWSQISTRHRKYDSKYRLLFETDYMYHSTSKHMHRKKKPDMTKHSQKSHRENKLPFKTGSILTISFKTPNVYQWVSPTSSTYVHTKVRNA